MQPSCEILKIKSNFDMVDIFQTLYVLFGMPNIFLFAKALLKRNRTDFSEYVVIECTLTTWTELQQLAINVQSRESDYYEL